MKTTAHVLALLMAMACLTASAQTNHETGVGLIVGDPTGISLKHWLGPKTALDAAVGWSLSGNESLHVHADYLIHDFDSLKVEKGRLAWYYGIGGSVITRDKGDDLVGVRIPFGVDYFFEKAPVDLFFEIAPLLEVLPNTEIDVEAGFGARYYFH